MNRTYSYCDKCGKCCKMFDRLSGINEFEFLNNGTGECKYLNKNICTIYNKRPDICNTSWVYEHYYKDDYTWEEYEKILWELCKKIKEGEHLE